MHDVYYAGPNSYIYGLIHTIMNKEETLYLPIKQVYFDEIVAGTKKAEYREIKEGITANRYLQKDENGKYVLNPEVTESGKEYFIDDYKYKYLPLAVGYAKERDTAIVEVTGYSFEPNLIRCNLYAFWTIVYHLGEVIEVHRK